MKLAAESRTSKGIWRQTSGGLPAGACEEGKANVQRRECGLLKQQPWSNDPAGVKPK
jgi:hypothetical protein